MPTILVTGSLAYDYIMHFGDTFSKHILADKIDKLNVSFTASDLSKNRGGTAGNISYSLALLKETPVIATTVGKDFDEYRTFLEQRGIVTSEIVVLENEWTASAHIITDLNANQITAFHGGAMLANDFCIKPTLDKFDIKIAIIAADGKTGMLRHAETFRNTNTKYIYDPGHSLPAFNGEEIMSLLNGSHIVLVNSYEADLIVDKTGKSLEELRQLVDYFIVTLGGEGSVIYHKDEETKVAVVKTDNFVDPTGAGDAYRAGLLKGLVNDLPMETCGQLASTAACYAVECTGTQNFAYDAESFIARFSENYGQNEDVVKLFNG
ncbi:carbohydrate kinase family protein [Candidatus Uabimicrobium amorphum]|uniref:Carbohydrate kinase n=1 Tax=Uabimicrobium amorphum TaxID=2596890 RepID=A0A5S9F0P2_UABAM|nr:carbohydrate kinase family protein [Candidatus Uabimicrobium amorphum]BBM81787.1 carbohydrate kinase [Candidatus Uabimicrobium amorphum]